MNKSIETGDGSVRCCDNGDMDEKHYCFNTQVPHTPKKSIELEVVKIRNGCWRVMQGNKKVSEHSMRDGAERMLESMLKKQENKSIQEIMLQADIMFCETCMRQNKKWLAKTLTSHFKKQKIRLKTILTDPDNYLRGNLEDYLKEL